MYQCVFIVVVSFVGNDNFFYQLFLTVESFENYHCVKEQSIEINHLSSTKKKNIKIKYKK